GPNHAKTIVRSRDDLLKFNGVIILSGDGLVFEVINGLFERSDRTSIIPCLPIGIVPSGSGNGLLCSLLFSRGVSFHPSITNGEGCAQPVNMEVPGWVITSLLLTG
ncbi:diacylglycerol kinase catalytic domain protein, partial [Necator americanus]